MEGLLCVKRGTVSVRHKMNTGGDNCVAKCDGINDGDLYGRCLLQGMTVVLMIVV